MTLFLFAIMFLHARTPVDVNSVTPLSFLIDNYFKQIVGFFDMMQKIAKLVCSKIQLIFWKRFDRAPFTGGLLCYKNKKLLKEKMEF